jgi:hypothetical protein
MKGCNLANTLLASYDNSHTEARLDGDIRFTPKTAAVGLTQNDLGGLVGQLQRLILEPTLNDGQGPRDTAGHSSFGPSSRPDTAAVTGSDQPHFDLNEPPSAAAAAAITVLEFGDKLTFLDFTLWGDLLEV